MHKILVNGLVKPAQEKSVIRWTDHPDMIIAIDWDVKHQTKSKYCMKKVLWPLALNLKFSFVLPHTIIQLNGMVCQYMLSITISYLYTCTLFRKQCRSRSAGFWGSQLIRIHTVSHQHNESILIVELYQIGSWYNLLKS